MSGFASRNGFEDREPVLPPLAMADMIAGLYGALATVVAVRDVELNGGAGQVIDLSLLDSIFSILGPEPAIHRLSGKIRASTPCREKGTEHKKHKRHKRGTMTISCASCASCVPSPFLNPSDSSQISSAPA